MQPHSKQGFPARFLGPVCLLRSLKTPASRGSFRFASRLTAGYNRARGKKDKWPPTSHGRSATWHAILPVLHPFATLFRNPTWLKAQILLVGAILAPGQRTVAAALRVMGRSDHLDYARYHEVLNRAVWSPRQAARILLMLLLQHLDQGDGPLVFGIDETLERRRGPKIKARGVYRDAVRSSRQQLVKASGLRWISLMWLGHVPWAGRYWALPFLTVLAPSERYYRQRGRRHKKPPTGLGR